MSFRVRVEQPLGRSYDTGVHGESLDAARTHFEKAYPQLAPFYWTGQVVFVSGTIGAEWTRSLTSIDRLRDVVVLHREVRGRALAAKKAASVAPSPGPPPVEFPEIPSVES